MADGPLIWIPGVSDVQKDREAYADAKFERNPHGVIYINGQEVASTLQCPHCGGHFISRKGSGIRRSFCMRCEAVTCGAAACMNGCTPFAAELQMNQSREV